MKSFKLFRSVLIIAMILSLSLSANATRFKNQQQKGSDGKSADAHSGNAAQGGARNGGNYDGHNGNRGNWNRGDNLGGIGVDGVVPVDDTIVPVNGAVANSVLTSLGLGAYGATCNQINAVSCTQYAAGVVCPALTYTYSCVCYIDGTCNTLTGTNSCIQCQEGANVVSVLDGSACQAC